ncbi:MAG: sodium/solute symporter, partial [Ignavibacteriales bacterium]|nr:sodium/solute symporter [Ignavibacteriales bacterium]
GALGARFSSLGLDEFFLGGRKMNKFVVALSAVASGRSSWLLIGLTGMAFARGASAIWAAAGYVVVEFLMFLYAAPRLRDQTEAKNDLTISDYFASRHNDKKNALRLLSAVIIIVFSTAYVSAQFVGGGKAFSASFQVSPDAGVAITAIVVFLYTALGGFLAVSITDVIQAIFMFFALFVLPAVAIVDFGGVEAVMTAVRAQDAALLDPMALGWGALVGFLGIGLGSPGNPHILVRYMSIERSKDLKFSGYVGTFWNATMAIAAVVIGVVGRAYFSDAGALPYGDAENLYPFLAQLHLHPIIFGVVVASILAAIMSTADSMLLVCASALIRDVWQRSMKSSRELSQKELTFYSRFVIFLIVVAATIFGYIASDVVFWLVLFAWAGLGAAFGPPILLSLFWDKANRYGAAAGMIVGMLSVIVWNQTPALKDAMYELVPAFFLSAAATIVGSLATAAKVAEERGELGESS